MRLRIVNEPNFMIVRPPTNLREHSYQLIGRASALAITFCQDQIFAQRYLQKRKTFFFDFLNINPSEFYFKAYNDIWTRKYNAKKSVLCYTFYFNRRSRETWIIKAYKLDPAK